MILTFRPIKVWPTGWPNPRGGKSSPFNSSYRDTLDLLDRELSHLGAKDPILQVDASERECRLDGQLRADARVSYRGVILSFGTGKYGTLSYPCDAFTRPSWKSNAPADWQQNLRAIALGLEALRKVKRYGIAQRGQQYAGYAEIGTGIALGQSMTLEEAARFIAGHGDQERFFDSNVEALLDLSQPAGLYEDVLNVLFRSAAKKLHPDNGGVAADFDRLVRAKELLETAQ